MTVLHLISAGAAQGLVQALEPRWAAETSGRLEARFGAVGAMKEALLGGAPCDLMITTEAMIGALAAEGRLDGGSSAALGRVATGIAVRAAAARPEVGSAEALRAALLAADEVYFPDPERATAGIHFANVLRRLSIHDELQPRCRTFPNGATAMRTMAERGSARAIGCTQVTEILATAGVALVAPLPAGLELVTTYAAALAAGSGSRALAQALLALLTAPAQQALRASCGFEP